MYTETVCCHVSAKEKSWFENESLDGSGAPQDHFSLDPLQREVKLRKGSIGYNIQQHAYLHTYTKARRSIKYKLRTTGEKERRFVFLLVC